MHESRQLSAIMWKDKKPVVIISSHAVPIQFPYQYPIVSIPRRNGSIHEEILTSPMHLEYTTHMHGVDVADQLWIHIVAKPGLTSGGTGLFFFPH